MAVVVVVAHHHHNTSHLSRTHGPCDRAVSKRGRREGRQRHVAGFSCNIDDSAVYFVDCCLRCSSLLRRLFQRSTSSTCTSSTLGLGSGAGDRATRTPNSTPHVRTAQRAPVSSIDTLRMTTVEHRAYIHTRQQQQQQQQHQRFSALRLFQRSSSSSIVSWALVRVMEPHAHRTARPTYALHNAPRCRRLTPSA